MVTKTLFPIDQAAEKTNPPTTPMYSPHGYIVQPDGTTWALFKQWTHGFVLALLYPEVAAAYTERALEYPESLSEVDVFAFQAFELDKARELNCVRVCPTRMASPPSVDLPFNGCTPEQKEALRIVLYVALGYSHTDFINTQHRDMTVRYTMELAEMTEDQRLTALFGESDPKEDW